MVVLLVVPLLSCSPGGDDESTDESGSPGRRFYLSEEQVTQLERSADTGDVSAVTKLINHYQWAVSDSSRSLYWLRRGAALNEPMAMINLSGRLSAMENEADCAEAEALLVRLLESDADDQAKKIARSRLDTLHHGVSGERYCIGSPPAEAGDITQGWTADEGEVSSSVPKKCLEVIHSYVKKSRGWEPDTYVVDGESLGTDGLGFSIWLLRETEVTGPPGGGEAFHVDLDHDCLRVTGELGYQ